jgi:hypothetical protein
LLEVHPRKSCLLYLLFFENRNKAVGFQTFFKRFFALVKEIPPKYLGVDVEQSGEDKGAATARPVLVSMEESLAGLEVTSATVRLEVVSDAAAFFANLEAMEDADADAWMAVYGGGEDGDDEEDDDDSSKEGSVDNDGDEDATFDELRED